MAQSNSNIVLRPLLNSTALAAIALAMAAPSATAQQAAPARVVAVEEIVVSARLREESLQDVPASIVAYSGDAVQAEGYIDLQTLSVEIPNFHYSNATGASDVLVMRGLGTVGSGPHFEPAVGQVFNGFFASRSRLGRTAFMDMAQLEVLRGPQGAIIGKNTSLGAINVTPKKPTEELELSFVGSYDFLDTDGFEGEAVVSGPLTDAIRARAAVSYRDRDGWIRNTVRNNTSTRSEDFVTRLIVEGDVSENITAELMWQRTDLERDGKARELSFCPNPAAALSAIGDDCTLNQTQVNANFFNGEPIGELFDLDSNLVGLIVSFDFDSFTIRSLSGYQEYSMFDQFDSDLSPADSRTILNNEEYEQFSQEIRFISNAFESIDIIAGALYLHNEIDFLQDSDFRVAPGVGGPLRRRQTARVETDNISVFGEITWHATSTLSINAGLRFTHEERDGEAAQTNFDIYTENNEGARCGGPAFRICNDVMDEIKDDDLSWNANVQWRPVDGTMLYGAVATGFKSGAFNLTAGVNQATLEQIFTFGPEESTNFEIGGKHDFLSNRVRFNWTAFYTQVTDLQVSQNDPVLLAPIVAAAGKARSVGLEVDGKWAVTERLSFSLSGAYLDSKYKRFANAPCFTGQTAAEGCTTVGNQRVQDLAGERPTRAPEWQFVLGGDYSLPVGDNLELTTSVKWIFVDDHVLAVDNDPRSVQESYSKINASITLASLDGRWSVALVGRNLNDKITKSFDDATTAINAFGGPGGRFANTEEGATLGLRARFAY